MVGVIAPTGGTDWAEFLGRFHPLLVHLPIGLIAGVVLAEVTALVSKSPMSVAVRRVLYLAAALGAAASAGAGWLLAGDGRYAHDPLFWHRWLGVGLAVVMAGCAVVAWPRGSDGATAKNKMTRLGVARVFGLLAAAGLVTITGHLGGSLTHGETYLTEYAPAWTGLRPSGQIVEVSNVSEGLSADAVVLMSTLRARCFECHGATKQKGNLRLDLPDGIASVVVAGDPGLSELFRRVSLDPRDRDAMPPDGEPLTDDEVVAMMRWIRDGASLGAVSADLASEAADAAATAAMIDEVRAQTGALITVLPTEDGSAGGGAVGGLFRVDFSLGMGEVSDEQLLAMGPIASRIAELSLAGQDFEAFTLTELGTMPRLRRVHLERTGVDDSDLELLLEVMPGLEYVNLHTTDVGDDGLEMLGGLSGLTRLVLMDTLVSGDGLADFVNAHPAVEVTTNLALPAVAFADRGPRRILASDYSKGRIALLREVALGRPETVWEHPIKDIHDLHVLENGNVLFQDSWTHLLEVNPKTGETVWEYDAATTNRDERGERVEVHAFERLAGGVTMIAESGPARIIEVGADGALLSQTPLTVDHPDAHHDTRLVRKTDAGTYLVAHENDGKVREYATDGEVVWEYEVPRDTATDPEPSPIGYGNALFSAVRLRNGNTLIGTGNGHRVLEVNPAGEIVWSVGQTELEGVVLAWVTTVQELANGNIVIGNCHAGEGQPQIVEVTREKDVVWKFYDWERFGNALANSLIIEDTEDANRGD